MNEMISDLNYDRIRSALKATGTAMKSHINCHWSHKERKKKKRDIVRVFIFPRVKKIVFIFAFLSW